MSSGERVLPSNLGAPISSDPGEQQAAWAAALGALDRMVRVLGMLRHACRCRFTLYTGASPRCHGPLEHDIVSRRPCPSTIVSADRRHPSLRTEHKSAS